MAIDAIEPSAQTIDLTALPSSGSAEAPPQTQPAAKPPAKDEKQEVTTDSAAVAKADADPTATPPNPKADSKDVLKHRVLLVSDGGFDAQKLPSHVELVKIGVPLDNIGIVAADMAYLAGDTGRLGIYYQVVSTFTEPQKVDLTLSSVAEDGREQLHKVIPLTVKPGTNSPETFELANAPAGRWLAHLDLADALAEDNTAYLAVAKPEAIRVGVESPDPFFLENSVQAFSRGEALLSLVKENPAVVLAKSAAPKSDLSIIFQPAGEAPWWTEIGEEIEAGAARVLVETHPVLRHLDAASIPFVGARQIAPAAGAQILVADDRGLPLIYKARHGARTAIIVNLDPVAAEFYFSAWFPILVHSSVTHLAGRENAISASYRPGESVPIPAGRDDVVTKIVPPPIAANNSGSAPERVETPGTSFRGIDRLGFYTLENPSGQYIVGASLLTPEESLLNNVDATDKHAPLSRGHSPAAWLTLMAIVALAAESILYHRRKVG
jgi:hypothetical protein